MGTNLTQEQYDILDNVKKKVINRQEGEYVVDNVTGDILSSTTKEYFTAQAKEPDFIKLYYSTMLAFQGVDDVPITFVCALSEHISFSNDGKQMHFNNIKDTRTKICARCGIGDTMYKRYITRSKKYGLLIPREDMRGSYIVNPFFIAKGRWNSIRQLQAQFDFVNGKWVYNAIREEGQED